MRLGKNESLWHVTLRRTHVLILKPFINMIKIIESPFLSSGTVLLRLRPSLSRVFRPGEPAESVQSDLHISYGCDQTTSLHEFVLGLKRERKHWGYPLTDIWSRVRDQGGGSQRSCWIILRWGMITTWVQNGTNTSDPFFSNVWF